jgi:cytochrome c peroxidase
MGRVCLGIAFVLLTLGPRSAAAAAPDPTGFGHLLDDARLQQLGEKIFFDEDLSRPAGQSCAVCHGLEAGWTGPDDAINRGSGVYEGARKGRFGNRKPTTAAYATWSPPLHLSAEGFVGGNFWDGRATGCLLGNPAADQAQGPFLNPLEQNLPDARQLVQKICTGSYGRMFQELSNAIWKKPSICKPAHTDLAFAIVAWAIAAFEHSAKVSPFDSKYDAYLAGKAQLSDEERRGLDLFNAKAKCFECHPGNRGPGGQPPLFTDFTYDNLGIPPNPDNPFYKMAKPFNPQGKRWVDPGLAEALAGMPQYAMLADAQRGKHRVPTLRNVDRRPGAGFTKAFGHNGYFKSLEAFVHFYNTRDVLPDCARIEKPVAGQNCWPAPEARENLNKDELGDLKLTPEEEQALAVFLRTLSDGFSEN